MTTKNQAHTHVYKLGKSGTVEICSCGRFRHVGNFEPIVAVEAKARSPLPGTVGEHPKDKSGTEWREILYPSEFGPAYIGQALESDAQLIVKAVNCHDQLLEACKFALTSPDDEEAIRKLEAAISKAQGEV